MSNINKVEEIISAFSDFPNHDRIADGLRYFDTHPDAGGSNYVQALTRQIAIPSFIRLMQMGKHPTVPCDMIIDELIDFGNIFIAQNVVVQNGMHTLRLHAVGGSVDLDEFHRDPQSFLFASFTKSFDEYLEKVLGDT